MNTRTSRLQRRPITSLAMLFGLALAAALAPSPVGAQSWTPEQRAACENDAMRLCGQFVPDVQRITACMGAKRSQLSPRCRVYFGKKKRGIS